MQRLRPIPYATLALALLISIIQISRMNGESYNEFLQANLNVLSWSNLYSQPWRILTSPFLHQNLLHYLENLVFLLLFGWQIERKYGSGMMLGVFFGALVTGYVIWINLMHNWIIGISGGVCGLFGFSLVANRLTPWWKTLTHRPLHILYTANLLFAVFSDITNLVPFQVAHLNHVVGILFGAAFAGVFLVASRRLWSRLVVVALPVVIFASQMYSPWQVEWRMIQRQPLVVANNEVCQLRSIEQDTYTPAPIRFVNTSSQSVAVYWLDYEGEAQLHFWLKPGASKDYNSFIDHPWCIVDIESKKALQATIVTESEQTIIIR